MYLILSEPICVVGSSVHRMPSHLVSMMFSGKALWSVIHVLDTLNFIFADFTWNGSMFCSFIEMYRFIVPSGAGMFVGSLTVEIVSIMPCSVWVVVNVIEDRPELSDTGIVLGWFSTVFIVMIVSPVPAVVPPPAAVSAAGGGDGDTGMVEANRENMLNDVRLEYIQFVVRFVVAVVT